MVDVVDLMDQPTQCMSNIICRPCITLRNGRVLWASEVGKRVFCFRADPNYWKRKEKKEAALLRLPPDSSES